MKYILRSLSISFCLYLFVDLFAQAADFIDNKNGSVTDKIINLIWQQLPATQSKKNWQAALKHCENLTHAGYSDWRFPDIDELKSIIDNNYSNPAINQKIFPNTKSALYWSSTIYGDGNDAWLASFSWGKIFDSDTVYDKGDDNYFRCVRGV